MGELVGYARVSTNEQNLDLQIDELKKKGCNRIFADKISGVKKDRPQFQAMMDYVRPGDTVVVWKLDRLGRSLLQNIKTVVALGERDIQLISITQNIDTSTPGGKFMFYIFGAIAEMERDLIAERTKAGLQAARARGRHGGRPKLIDTIDKKKLQLVRDLYFGHDNTMSVSYLMQLVGIKSKATFYKIVVNPVKEQRKE